MRSMKPARWSALALTLTGVFATAPSIGDGAFGGSLAATSDYVYQGLSQTCGHPAAQVDVYFRTSGGASASESFVGLWGSAGLGTSHCDDAREINIYGGHTFALGQSSNVSVQYVHYAFPGGSYVYERFGGERYDYDELEGTWSYQDRLYVTVNWSPNAVQYRNERVTQDRSAFNYGAQLHQPLRGALYLSVGAGYDEVYDPSGVGYAFWDAGLGYTLGKVELTASYFRTATRAERLFGSYVAGGRGAVTAVWRF
jgi:uncharacterized protein (TIGR02001 family)